MKIKPILFLALASTACFSTAMADTSAPPVLSAPKSAPLPQEDGLPIMDYDGVIDRFIDSYKKQGKPTILIYVNRDLIKDRGELVETTRTETSTKVKGDPVPLTKSGDVQIGSGNSTEKGTVSGSGKGGERATMTTTSKRVTDPSKSGLEALTDYEVREIEEAFSRPFFDGGAKIVDQKLARVAFLKFQEAGDNFINPPTTAREKEDLETLRRSTDIVIEILARKREIVIPTVSGENRVYNRIELTATATSLKNGVKIAQVNSNSMFGFNRRDGEFLERRSRSLANAEISEQVGLAVLTRLTE